ncbi:hypothetical protein FRC05_005493 [Tulasnella sp. 425]|nr:hypothetical protein FRC05_005493 [Tulasnella sp. 425]
MKPPQKEAVAEALSILMGSVNKENDTQEIPVAFASLASLPDNVEALALAKACINKELDTLISSMQHRSNLAAPIHKLPIEVLVMIFAHFTASSSLSDNCSLLELTTVNKLWYDAIVHSPQLWTVVESYFSPKIAKLVVQRSKNLPLSLIWDNRGCDENEQPELAEILDLLVQNSARLRSIKITVPTRSEPSVRRLLESNMPHLQKLQVEAVWEPYSVGESLEEFELMEGPPLREISLGGVCLSSWSSPRLSRLVALDITKPHPPPSIEQLLAILANSTQLERLGLCEWYRSGTSPWKPLSDRPITLPHLKDFDVQCIDRSYFVALLTSVYSPSTRSVTINTGLNNSGGNPLEEVFALGADQLTALLGLANSGPQSPSTPVAINISVETSELQIGKFGNNEARQIFIRLDEEHCAQAASLLGQLFLALPHPPEVELSIYTLEPLDLSPWSRCLRKLSVHCTVVCRAVVKQLAQRTVDPIKGVTTWMCPNLASIDLCYLHSADEIAELDGVALETLVRARWSDTGAAEQLLEFTVRCEAEAYPSIWSRAAFLKEATPCLSLVDTDTD